MHIRRRAGQEHAVGDLEQIVELVGIGARHDQRLAAGQPDRVDVLLRGHVEAVVPEHAVAGRHEDDGLRVAAA
jgi:hypothetical protein